MPKSLVSCLVDGTKGFFGDGTKGFFGDGTKGFFGDGTKGFFPAGGPIVVFFAAVPG
jgi:hypothetical protein